MSKTFKALLRAAHERAGRRPHGHQRQGEPSGPPVVSRFERPAAEAESGEREVVKPLVRFETAQVDQVRPGETVLPGARPLPSGEPDPELRALLEMELMVSANGGVMENDGWMRGNIDRRLAKRLLDRYGLLHVLMQNERSWFWFWASSTDARATAESCGLPLDLEDKARD